VAAHDGFSLVEPYTYVAPDPVHWLWENRLALGDRPPAEEPPIEPGWRPVRDKWCNVHNEELWTILKGTNPEIRHQCNPQIPPSPLVV
jgi:hypothetical protein